MSNDVDTALVRDAIRTAWRDALVALDLVDIIHSAVYDAVYDATREHLGIKPLEVVK